MISRKFINALNTITVISVLMILFDYLYLSSFSKHFSKVFKSIQGSEMKVKLLSAAGVYILMVFTVYYYGFVRKLSAVDMGLLGALIYGIYEWTNHATIDAWPYWMIALDTVWGGLLFFMVSSSTKIILSRI